MRRRVRGCEITQPYPRFSRTVVLLARHYFNVPLKTQDHSYGFERRDDATVVRGRAVRGSLRMRDGPGGGG